MATEPARLGHHVTVFESLHEARGVLVNGIPAFRFPQEIVNAEINTILYKGVDLRLNHLVGRSITVDELPAYDAVSLGTGAGLPNFMGIPGEQLPGVYSANEFLTRMNLMHADRFPAYDTPVKQGRRGTIMVDDDGRTALQHVYAGGDVTTGAATVILAMGAAKKLPMQLIG